MSPSARSSVFWAATWAAGVAVGVALGAWLSVIGAQGAPGTASLDAGQELLVAPAVAGIVVFLVYLAVSALWRLFHRGASGPPEGDTTQASSGGTSEPL